jgi:hypothetical protein
MRGRQKRRALRRLCVEGTGGAVPRAPRPSPRMAGEDDLIGLLSLLLVWRSREG